MTREPLAPVVVAAITFALGISVGAGGDDGGRPAEPRSCPAVPVHLEPSTTTTGTLPPEVRP